jgi:hypothetical protein
MANRASSRPRFPADFPFQLTPGEFEDLRRQFGTASQWDGRRYPPYALTEHGMAMLSSVLPATGPSARILATNHHESA